MKIADALEDAGATDEAKRAVLALYEGAAARATSPALRFHARFATMSARSAFGDAEGALREARGLADMRPIGADASVFFQIADALASSPADEDRAAATLRAGLALAEEVAVPFELRLADLARAKERWGELLAWGVSLARRTQELDVRGEAQAAVVTAACGLGTRALPVIAELPDDALSGFALGVAQRALAQIDLELAKGALELVVARAPESLHAATASAVLVRLAAARGAKDAAALRAAHERRYAADGAWARALLARPSPPSRDRLVEAAEARPWVVPPDTADERLARLVACAVPVPQGARIVLGKAAPGVSVEVRVTVYDDGAPTVTAKAAKGSGLDVSCIAREAPRYFAGAREGAHGIVTLVR